MAAVHILIFGEMAGFEILLFIARENDFFSLELLKKKKKKKKTANQNSPICMKTIDIKLYTRKRNLDLTLLHSCFVTISLARYSIINAPKSD